MTWLEVLHLRSNRELRNDLIDDLSGQIRNIKRTWDLRSIRIFRHQNIGTDLFVIIQFKQNDATTPPSELGLHLRSALRELGRVDHSVWFEV